MKHMMKVVVRPLTPRLFSKLLLGLYETFKKRREDIVGPAHYEDCGEFRIETALSPEELENMVRKMVSHDHAVEVHEHS